MHEPHHGSAHRPFSLAPDPRYLYRSASFTNALSLVRYAARRREGVIVLTGESGVGKTTLCRTILAQLHPKACSALVLNPFISEDDLLRVILQEFGVISADEVRRGHLNGVTARELIDTLHEFLVSLRAIGANALLVIDEAHSLTLQVLDQVRMLARLESAGDPLLHIVLVGQESLRDLLRSAPLRTFDEQISVRYHLRPFTRDETAAYIARRLRLAGGSVAFTPTAAGRVHRHTAGIPRTVNLLCDRVVRQARLQRTTRVGRKLVDATAQSVDLARPYRGPVDWMRQRSAALVTGAAIVAAAAAIAYGVTQYHGQEARPQETAPVSQRR
ncbi:MAG TPA: AAA family ATPase [Vicinamibacterales bacterium]|nr:AAA family ATPase [Vicinamibacterales bacterium]